MPPNGATSKKSFRIRLFLPVLLLAVFATYISATVFQLVLLDIATSLNTTPGTVSQIPAIARLVGVGVGLVTSFLSIKIKHKSLLLLGLALSATGALGNSFATDVFSMAFTDSFRGAGFVIIGAMALALIGELIPKEKNGWAVGWIQASTFLAYLIGFPVTSLLTNISGWRSVMSFFIFPVAISAIILVFLVIPASKPKSDTIIGKSYRKAYKDVLSNRCALSSLFAYALNFASAAFLTYYVSFYRIQFSMPLYIGSIIGIIGATTGTVGSIVAGRFLEKTGRKRLGVVSALINGAMVMSFLNMPTLLLSSILRFVAAFFGSTALVAFIGLAIEQCPDYRGTLMSLNTTIGGLGTVLGLTVGGFVLNLFNNYQILMLVFGGFGIGSAVVFLLLGREQTKSQTLMQSAPTIDSGVQQIKVK
jgi:predicted MFS family arabinose efflux permease